MAPVQTYVFLDLETTGLPKEEHNRTKITEISMIAVKRSHMLETRKGAVPRVQHKITFCLNPGKQIYPSCTEVTGLCNDLLEYEPYFNKDIFTALDTFLKVLQKPVCLLAQNGYQFDYPILKNHLVKLGVSFCDDLLCADTLFAFYDFFQKSDKQLQAFIKADSGFGDDVTPTKNEEGGSRQGEATSDADTGHNVFTYQTTDLELINDPENMRLKNESTPNKAIKFTPTTPSKSKSRVCRRFPWSNGNKPKESYKLEEIYDRLLNHPPLEAHRAENDCIMTLECAVVVGKDFVQFVDLNHKRFADVKPMEIGVPIGN